MEIVEVNATLYSETFPQPHQVFNGAAFNAVNAYNVNRFSTCFSKILKCG